MKTYVEIKLDGKPYKLTPSPAALMAIADGIGDPFTMAVTFGAGTKMPDMKKELFGVLKIALRESGYDEFTDDEMHEMFFRAGIAKLYDPYAEFLGALVNAGEVPEEEKPNRRERRKTEATAAKKKSTTPAS